VASSGTNQVLRMNGFSVAAAIPAGSQPRGLDFDQAGKLWVANQGSDDVMRIDPATNLVDLTVALRPGAMPYNPSDMIGTIIYDTSAASGSWSVVTDGGQSGTQWTDISWNGSEPANSSLSTLVRAADSIADLMNQPFVPATNGGGIALMGRFLESRVDFLRSTTTHLSPILFDLSVVGENPPAADCETPNRRQAASLLIFPEYDNLQGSTTVLTVTNVDPDLVGTLAIEFVYVNGESCLEFNRTEYLTANDTVTLLTKWHNPNPWRGYVYVFAKDADSGEAIVANSLIGQAIVIRPSTGVSSPGRGESGGPAVFGPADYAFNAVGFKGIGVGGLTDVDLDGLLDLDGDEYDMAPASILIPRFLGQGGLSQISSSLVLVALTGGVQFDTTVDFMVYNDNEEAFSAEYTFHCWQRAPLTDISMLFTQEFLSLHTNHDSAEILGATGVESGWMRIDGALASSSTTSIADPVFLAMLIEHIGSSGGADLPFELCTQPGGVLLPSDTHGGQ
jgi:hypothetical protein